MTPEKKTDAAVRPQTTDSSAASGKRKSWTPKSPIDVVLDQIGRQEKKVVGLQRLLDNEKATLSKLLQAKKVLEG